MIKKIIVFLILIGILIGGCVFQKSPCTSIDKQNIIQSIFEKISSNQSKKTFIVMGDRATADDVITSSDIETLLEYRFKVKNLIRKLAGQVDENELLDNNIISVGGPCANSISKSLLEYKDNCAEGFNRGQAKIIFVETKNNIKLVVAGYSEQDTSSLVKVIDNFPANYRVEKQNSFYPEIVHNISDKSTLFRGCIIQKYVKNESIKKEENISVEEKPKSDEKIKEYIKIKNFTIPSYSISSWQRLNQSVSEEFIVNATKLIIHKIFAKPTPCNRINYTVTQDDSGIYIIPKDISQDKEVYCVQVIAYDSIEIIINLTKGNYNVYVYNYWEQDKPAIKKSITIFPEIYYNGETGIYGTITLRTGNCMPRVCPEGGCGPSSCYKGPATGNIYVFNSTILNNQTELFTVMQNSDIRKSIAKTTLNGSGFYNVSVPSGNYVLFIHLGTWLACDECNVISVNNSYVRFDQYMNFATS